MRLTWPLPVQADLEDPDAPYSSINYGSKAFPTFTPLGGGTCNVDLPNDSILNRYLFVIQYYVSQVCMTINRVMLPHAAHTQLSVCLDTSLGSNLLARVKGRRLLLKCMRGYSHRHMLCSAYCAMELMMLSAAVLLPSDWA